MYGEDCRLGERLIFGVYVGGLLLWVWGCKGEKDWFEVGVIGKIWFF